MSDHEHGGTGAVVYRAYVTEGHIHEALTTAVMPPDKTGPPAFFIGPAEGENMVGDADDYMLVCLHCLIDAVPELGRGLDLAREPGVTVAFFDPLVGEWQTTDLPVDQIDVLGG